MNFPEYDFDIYSDEGILSPHSHYQKIRDLGPVVYLKPWDTLMVGRHNDVMTVLRDNQRFISGKGVAINEQTNTILTTLGGGSLTSDQPRHTQIRKVLMRPLSPPALQALKDTIQQEANQLVDRLVARGQFDGVKDFAQHLPLTIVSKLVGLPEEGREQMLEWAAAGFESFGPDNERFRASSSAPNMFIFIANCKREQIAEGTWGAALYDALDKGEIDQVALNGALGDYSGPSLDTTIGGTSQMLYQLGANEDQWNLVKNDPSLIDNVVEESLRIEAPIRGFTRFTAEDVELSGVTVPADKYVLVLYGSASRDERQFENPEVFNIQRGNVKKHMSFGNGIHQCLGQHLARLEMRCLLQAMVDRVDKIEVSNAKYALNNTLRVFGSMEASFMGKQ